MKKIYYSVLFLSLPFFANSQNISFYAEDLNFFLNEKSFEVDGLYYFRNNTDREIKLMLFYPFPDIAKYGNIDFIKIHIQGDTTSMLATQSAKGSLFKVKIPARGEIAYRINYRQKCKSNQAKYIITTTQQWNKPFELANYSLTFPESIIIDSISITPDSVFNLEGKHHYLWMRKNFMPMVDFEIEFSNNK